jgi:hypothetical protein
MVLLFIINNHKKMNKTHIYILLSIASLSVAKADSDMTKKIITALSELALEKAQTLMIDWLNGYNLSSEDKQKLCRKGNALQGIFSFRSFNGQLCKISQLIPVISQCIGFGDFNQSACYNNLIEQSPQEEIIEDWPLLNEEAEMWNSLNSDQAPTAIEEYQLG